MPTRAVAFLATSELEQALRFYPNMILSLIEETLLAIVFDAFGTQLRVHCALALPTGHISR